MHSTKAKTVTLITARPAHFDDQQQACRAAWLAQIANSKQKNGTLGAIVSAMLAVAVGAIAADWATGEVIATQLANLLSASL